MSEIDHIISISQEIGCDFFGGWRPGDVELLRPYRVASEEAPVVGELVDWLGIRTKLTMHSWLHVPDAGYIQLSRLPFPNDWVHAEAIEYISLIIALERALAGGLSGFTAMELGASYGPWITAAGVLAGRNNFANIDLTAVEASKAIIPSIKSHALLNGLKKPRFRVNAIHAAVNVEDKPLFFPRVDVASDNGARTSKNKDAIDYRGVEVEYDRVRGVTLETLCKDKDRVDFLHLDLQGAEEALLQDVGFLNTLDNKVATFFLATQSRFIEGIALRSLVKMGWQLIRERPTTYSQNDRTNDVNGWTTRDGAQLWLNPRFGNEHIGT